MIDKVRPLSVGKSRFRLSAYLRTWFFFSNSNKQNRKISLFLSFFLFLLHSTFYNLSITSFLPCPFSSSFFSSYSITIDTTSFFLNLKTIIGDQRKRMSRTVLSLCYSPIKSNQYDTTIIQGNSNPSNDHSNFSLIQGLCNKVMSLHRSCHIAILNNATSSTSSSPPDPTAVMTPNPLNRQVKPISPPKSTYNITITGPPDAVMMARTALLQACPLEIQLKLKIPIKDLPATFTDPACHNPIFERIRSETEARLSLILPTPNQQSYFESANVLGLSIVGLPYHAELARVRLLVALDDLVSKTTVYLALVGSILMPSLYVM